MSSVTLTVAKEEMKGEERRTWEFRWIELVIVIFMEGSQLRELEHAISVG